MLGGHDVGIRYLVTAADTGTRQVIAGQRAVQAELERTNALLRETAVSANKTAASFARGAQAQAASAGRAAVANERAAVRSGAAWGAAGKRMEGHGKTMQRHLTLPLLAVGAAGVKMALDFQSSMKLIQTQAGGTARDVQLLSKQVLVLGRTTTQGPNELAKGLYHLKSLGLDNAKAMDVLEQASRGATTGMANLEETTSALGAAVRTGIKGTGDYGKAMGILNAIVGAGNMRMGDLVEALGTGVLPAAKTAGLGIKDYGAALTLMTDEGQNASEASTRLRTAFMSLGAGSDKAQKALKGIGLSSAQLAYDMQNKGLPATIRDLKVHLDSIDSMKKVREIIPKAALDQIKQGSLSTEEFQKKLEKVARFQVLSHAFGGAKGASTIMLLVNQTELLQKKYDQIAHTSSKFGEDVAASMELPANRMRVAWSRIQVDLINMGGKLVPVVARIADEAARVADWFDRLSPSTKRWVGIFAGAAAVLGPVLIVLGSIVKMVGTLSGAMASLGSRWRTTAAETATPIGSGARGGAGAGVAGGVARGGLFNLTGRGRMAVGGAGLGIMAAGTALNFVPGISGSAKLTGNLAALGAGMGMMIGPEGALIGGLAGLTAGLVLAAAGADRTKLALGGITGAISAERGAIDQATAAHQAHADAITRLNAAQDNMKATQELVRNGTLKGVAADHALRVSKIELARATQGVADSAHTEARAHEIALASARKVRDGMLVLAGDASKLQEKVSGFGAGIVNFTRKIEGNTSLASSTKQVHAYVAALENIGKQAIANNMPQIAREALAIKNLTLEFKQIPTKHELNLILHTQGKAGLEAVLREITAAHDKTINLAIKASYGSNPAAPQPSSPRNPFGMPFQPPRKAAGGWVPGDPRKDGTLALMAGDEFVATGPGQQQAVAAGLAHPALWDWLAANQAPHFAKGGFLQPRQIAGLASQAGLSRGRLPTAVATSLAESGGNPNASNRNTDGSIDRGLWQINSVHGRLSTFDPRGNARAMASISHGGTDWTPWVTFKSGAYRTYMGTATAASGNPVFGAPGYTNVTSQVVGSGKGLPTRPDAFTAGYDFGLGNTDNLARQSFLRGVIGDVGYRTQFTRTQIPSAKSRLGLGAELSGSLGGKGGRSLASGTLPQEMMAAIGQARSMGLRAGENPVLPGGVHPVHVNGSWHYKHFRDSKIGRAVDVSGSASGMRGYFGWAAGSFGRDLKELFYDPAGYYIKNGSRVSGAIGGHTDHVHLALRRGGRVSSRGGHIPRFQAGGSVGGAVGGSATFGAGIGGSVGARRTPLFSLIDQTGATAAVGNQVAAALLQFNAMLAHASIGAIVSWRTTLEHRIRALQAQAATPETAREIKRLEGALRLADFAVGAYVGRLVAKANALAASIAHTVLRGGQNLRRAGVDPSSSAGMAAGQSILGAQLAGENRELAQLNRALAAARRLHAPASVVKGITDQIAQLRDDIYEGVTTQIENARALVRQRMADKSALASAGLATNQAAFAAQGLENTPEAFASTANLVRTQVAPADLNIVKAFQAELDKLVPGTDAYRLKQIELLNASTVYLGDLKAIADATRSAHDAMISLAQSGVDLGVSNLNIIKQLQDNPGVPGLINPTGVTPVNSATDPMAAAKQFSDYLRDVVAPAQKRVIDSITATLNDPALKLSEQERNALITQGNQAILTYNGTLIEAANLVKEAASGFDLSKFMDAANATGDLIDAFANLRLNTESLAAAMANVNIANPQASPGAIDDTAAKLAYWKGQLAALGPEIGKLIGTADPTAAINQVLALTPADITLNPAVLGPQDGELRRLVTAALGFQNKIIDLSKALTPQSLYGGTPAYPAATASYYGTGGAMLPVPDATSGADGGGDTAPTLDDLAAKAVDAANALKGLSDATWAHQELQMKLDGIASNSLEAMQAHIAFIKSSTLPALAAVLSAEQAHLLTAKPEETTGILTDIMNTSSAILQANLDIRDLTQQIAQLGVDNATHVENMANLGLEGLRLHQTLEGVYDTGAAGQARKEYIEREIIPAIQREIAALQVVQQAAKDSGDQRLADQIAESIAGKQNALIQEQVDAGKEVADNTKTMVDQLKDYKGSISFEYRGQQFSDLVGFNTGA